MFTFELWPLLQGQTRIAKLKSAYNSLIIGLGGLQCETNLQEIMDWESSNVVRFDLEPFLQGQTRTVKLKSPYNSLIIDPRGLQCKPTYRISWAGNLLMLSDFTFGPSFKVKRWLTGSFRGIQIYIGSSMHRSG